MIASIRRVDDRANFALTTAIQYATLLNVNYKSYIIDILDLYEAIGTIRNIIQEYASKSQVVIDASGGPRLLVIESLLAFLSLPSELLKNIRLVIYAEGSLDHIEIDYERLVGALALKPDLKEVEKELLVSMKPGIQYTLRELYEMFTRRGHNYSKQYILKLLKSLEKKGLVIKVAHGEYMRKL